MESTPGPAVPAPGAGGAFPRRRPFFLLALCACLPAAAAAQGDADLPALPAVVVTGERDDLPDALSPGVVSVAYPDDVKGEHKELADLLDQIPGVYVRRQSGSGHYTTASIRGGAPSQVNIYVDGVPMNLANETAADISTLPISNVERVEVYRGVTPARFSGAPVGGAINIVTKKPDVFSGALSAGGRSLGGEQYSASLNFPLLGGHMLIGLDKERSAGNFKYRDYTVRSLMDGIAFGDGTSQPGGPFFDSQTGSRPIPVDRRRRENGIAKENALFKWENRNFVAKFAATDLDRMNPASIRASLNVQDHRQDLPWATPSVFNQRMRQVMEKREALAGWRESFGRLDAALNLTWLKNRQRYTNYFLVGNVSSVADRSGGAWSNYTTTRKGISGDLAYRFGEGGHFVHQAEFHAAYTDERMEASMSGMPRQAAFLSDFQRKKYDFQIQDTITVAPLGDLQLTPLVRVEKLGGPALKDIYFTAFPAGKGDLGWKTTGSLSLKKTFESGWQVFGSRGNYVRYPNFYEIYGNGFGIASGVEAVGQGTALLPEEGDTTEAGFGWQGRLFEKTRANFRLTWFQRDMKRSIALYSTPIGAQYVNGGPSVVRGLELEGAFTLGRRADVQFAVTRQDGHFTGSWSYWGYPAGNTLTTPEYLARGKKVMVPNIPEIVANARLNLHFFDRDLSAFVEATHIGRNHLSNRSWENPLTTLNVGGSWRFARTGPGKGGRLSFGVNDVFNRGPKQTFGGEITRWPHTWRECRTADGQFFTIPQGGQAPGGYAQGCLLGPGSGSAYESVFPAYQVTVHQDGHPIQQNVNYPRDGRVYYVTMAWTF
jgi:outer membrane receptor protein involved in Fe transport